MEGGGYGRSELGRRLPDRATSLYRRAAIARQRIRRVLPATARCRNRVRESIAGESFTISRAHSRFLNRHNHSGFRVLGGFWRQRQNFPVEVRVAVHSKAPKTEPDPGRRIE